MNGSAGPDASNERSAPGSESPIEAGIGPGSSGVSSGSSGVSSGSGGGGCGWLGAGFAACSIDCVNLQTDRTNCGGCGKTCSTGEVCEGGTCTCLTGTYCGGACSNEQTDRNNCGACGAACSGSTPYCYQGSCTATLPSCAPGGPGITNCASGESCCTSLEVTGGTYYRTYTNAGTGATGEADPATISNFRLDKYLVTVGRFRQFVAAWNGGWLPPAGSGKHTHLNGGLGLVSSGNDAGTTYETGWLTSDNGMIAPTDANLVCGSSGLSSAPTIWATWTNAPGSQEDLPISCVGWEEAYAFCIWDGGFLPSEAEWEYAAAGGSQEREYPWGSTAPGTANQYAIYDCNYPGQASGGSSSGTIGAATSASGGSPHIGCTGVVNIAPVGTATLGAGLWGHLDMAGELQEFSLDLWVTPGGDFTRFVNPCTDCAYLSTTSTTASRVVRGGYYAFTAADLTPSVRQGGGGNSAVGFRCARTP
jgi:sulfatase modifying factor 1